MHSNDILLPDLSNAKVNTNRIPGVALGIFYLLLRMFNFKFSEITPTLTAVIAILSLLIVGGITFYVLYQWAPKKSLKKKSNQEKGPPEPTSNNTTIMHEFKIAEEIVLQEELLKSLSHDVLKINAHTHKVGVASEYRYINKCYPNHKVISQGLSTLDLLKKSQKYDIDQVHFDVITIVLNDGREKQILFDISSFFNKQGPLIDKDEFIAAKLNEIYA